jgi:hypothetical protein
MANLKLETNLPVKTYNPTGAVSIPLGQANAQGVLTGVPRVPLAQPTRVPISPTAAPVGVQIPFMPRE